MKTRNLRFLFSSLCLLLAGMTATGQNGTIDISSATPYTQNFNTVSTTLPQGFVIINGTTTGTYQSTVFSIKTYLSSSESGNSYKFNVSGDMAVGNLSSGGTSGTKAIKATLSNNTGGVITGLQISFNYEKYRTGIREWTYNFYADNVANAEGTHVFPGDPSNNNTSNPMVVLLSVPKTVTLTGLTINPGATYELRWELVGTDGHSNGQALGIDDVSITPTIQSCDAPTTATNVLFSNITNTTADASWTNGDGESRLVFIKQTSEPTDVVSIANGINPATITADASYGIGTQIGTSGWYCIYKGTGTTTSVTGLAGYTAYSVQVVEYKSCDGGHKYTASASTNNPNNFTTTQSGDISNVTTDNSSFCNGSANDVEVSFTSTLSSGTYEVQLSDATGDFTTPTTVGAGTASPITATIAMGTNAGEGYQLRVVSNSGGNFISTNAVPVSISALVEIGNITGNTVVCEGNAIDLSVVSANATSYQWLKDGDVITDATSDNFQIEAAVPSDAGVYEVVVANGACVDTSADATVSVNALPMIITQPQDVEGCEFTELDLSVEAESGSTYQWMTVDNGEIFGEQENVLTQFYTESETGYFVIVTNNGCSTSSDTVDITLSPSSYISLVSGTFTEEVPAESYIDLFNEDNCSNIVSILTAESDLGEVVAQVTVNDGPQQIGDGGDWYIGRVYDITPTNQPTDDVMIALAYTTDELNAYNAVAPADKQIIIDEANATLDNLYFSQFHGGAIIGDESEDMINPLAVEFTDGFWIVALNVSSFSSFAAHGSDAVLPINFKGISAVNKGTSNVITWETAAEDDGEYFELQRSADGKVFNTIATITGSGKAANYNYNDAAPFQGINYYRIYMPLNNHGGKYSKVVNATVSDKRGFAISAYPNPAFKNVTVSINGEIAANAIVNIMNATGKIVKNIVVNSNNLTIDISDVAAGLYTLQYSDRNNNGIVKVVVIK